MAIRDMEETVKRIKGRVPWHYDITVKEIETAMEMIDKSRDDEFEAILMIFDYGFVMGCRATRAGKVKKV